MSEVRFQEIAYAARVHPKRAVVPAAWDRMQLDISNRAVPFQEPRGARANRVFVHGGTMPFVRIISSSSFQELQGGQVALLAAAIEKSVKAVVAMYPRRELLNEVWGYNKRTEFDTRTVDIHIAKLRKKIENNPKNPSLLVTVRGEGYRLSQLPSA